jgi:hypothetical protein
VPKITPTPITGFAHCSQQITDGELAFDVDGTPNGEDRCPGYKQMPVAAISQLAEYTFGEFGAGTAGDPTDPNRVSHSHERIMWADLEDAPCPFCGTRRELTDQVRPVYSPLGGPRGNPEQIFADRRLRREQGQAMNKSAGAAERQAEALEEANRLKSRELDLREREIDAQEARAPIPAAPRRKAPARIPAEVE